MSEDREETSQILLVLLSHPARETEDAPLVGLAYVKAMGWVDIECHPPTQYNGRLWHERTIRLRTAGREVLIERGLLPSDGDEMGNAGTPASSRTHASVRASLP